MKKEFALTLLFLFIFILESDADTIYLKNGRSIEGIIKSEDENSVKLDIGIGTVGFKKSEIERITRSSEDESGQIRQKWDKQRLETEERMQKERTEREGRLQEEAEMREHQPKRIEVSEEKGHIFVNAILNKKVNVRLMMDTGASLILITNKVAKELGINTTYIHKRMLKMELADGRKVDAQFISLKSVSVQGVEVTDVDAAVLLEDIGDIAFKDGLLGMSFLNKFNFKVDQNNKQLILEKLQ
jgi:clan AA aspartic protease (TIGR02281 family)